MSCRTAAAGSGQCVRACAAAAGPELPADPSGGCKRGVFLTGIFPLLFVPAAAGVMELWAEMGKMLLPIIIAIIPVTVLVMVTAGKTTQALTSRKKNKETAANDGIAE